MYSSVVWILTVYVYIACGLSYCDTGATDNCAIIIIIIAIDLTWLEVEEVSNRVRSWLSTGLWQAHASLQPCLQPGFRLDTIVYKEALLYTLVEYAL